MPKIHFFTRADNEPGLITERVGEPKPVNRKNQYQVFSLADEQFIRDNYQTMTNSELAFSLGRSKGSVASKASKLRLIKTPQAKRLALSKEWQKRDVIWSGPEQQFLRDNYETMSNADIAKVLGRSAGSVKNKGRREFGLHKSSETIKAICSRPNSGQFKKGNLPANTVFGDEMIIRIRHNKKRNIYTKYIRIAFAKWQEYQHYIWEAANGPLPKGMILAFINGDRMDVRLDNLKLITKAENALRNSGSLNLADGFIAHTLAWHDAEMQQEMLQHPELIELKRNQLQLKRAIKSHDNPKPAKTRRARQSNGRKDLSR